MKKLFFLACLFSCRVTLSPPPPPETIDHPFVAPPRVTIPESGVRRERLILPGAIPPPNPVTQTATPADLNQTIVLRYREDTEDPRAARAILLAMPGFLGGGASFDALARALVKRGTADNTPIEVWAIDRRANLLEDSRGMDTAEALQDPEIAHAYYFGTDTVGGAPFAGFLAQEELPFVSEWGLETHVEDLRRVLSFIPQQERKARVFLLGHSLGASFTEAFAAWRFSDGVRGADELAGLILLDGVLSGAPISEGEYLNGVSGAFPSPGVTEIRASSRVSELPFIGKEVYTVSEILALRALKDPSGIVEDEERDGLLRFLMSIGTVPQMTNRAALAFGFDEASGPLIIAISHLGESTGGPLETYQSLFGGTLLRPSDPNAIYDWVDAFETQPPELTPVDALAQSMSGGASNFYEWYFPSRLPLDLSAVGGAQITEDGYQASFGLRAFDGALIDAPVLAVAAGITTVKDYEALRGRIAATIGQGRPNQGATRNETAGFLVLDATSFGHLDPVTAPDSAQNPIPSAIQSFVLSNTLPGGVSVSF